MQRALLFDVFGTVVDWRGGVIRELQAFGARHGIEADWPAFADDWRGLYQPSMEDVRSGRRPFTILDTLHRESLDTLLKREGIATVGAEAIDDLNRAWHRLDPWPDSVEGLTRLKRNHVIASLSNGNIALLVDMAKHGGLPWDAVLGAETAGAYKPEPRAYLRTAEQLGLAPGECMMVAAHNGDLEAAKAVGFKTAFIRRPGEHGPGQTTDLEPTGAWDFTGDSMIALADALG
jgi:2-haloacid dehalogenase